MYHKKVSIVHEQSEAVYIPHLHLTPNRAPHMVDSILLTYILGVVQRCRAIAICDNKYVLGWKDLQGCRKRRTDKLRGFVLQ